MNKKHIYIDGLQYGIANRAFFQEAKDAGLDVIHVTVVFWENITDTMELIGDWLRLFDTHADLIYPATDNNGLIPLKPDKLAVLFGFQNCSPIENNIDMVEIYRRLNVGVMQLSYNNQSPLCGGCYEDKDIGLSRFGKQVVKEMNRVGMVIDLSHSSHQATLEAIECSERPIAITHAQSTQFKNAVRNKRDDVIKQLAQSGGIFGMSFYPFHLKNTSDCTLGEMMDEVKRLIDLIGADALAIGSDICQGQPISALAYMRNGHWTKTIDYGESASQDENWPTPPVWFQRVSDFAKLEQAMIDHGLSAKEAEQVMGKNWFDFFTRSLTPQSS